MNENINSDEMVRATNAESFDCWRIFLSSSVRRDPLDFARPTKRRTLHTLSILGTEYLMSGCHGDTFSRLMEAKSEKVIWENDEE